MVDWGGARSAPVRFLLGALVVLGLVSACALPGVIRSASADNPDSGISTASVDCSPNITMGDANAPLTGGALVASDYRAWGMNPDGSVNQELSGFTGKIKWMVGSNPNSDAGALLATEDGVYRYDGSVNSNGGKVVPVLDENGKPITNVKGLAGSWPSQYGSVVYTTDNRLYLQKPNRGDVMRITGWSGTINNVTGGEVIDDVGTGASSKPAGFILGTTDGAWLISADGVLKKVNGISGNTVVHGDFPLADGAVSAALVNGKPYRVNSDGSSSAVKDSSNGTYTNVIGTGYQGTGDAESGYFAWGPDSGLVFGSKPGFEDLVGSLKAPTDSDITDKTIVGATGTSPFVGFLVHGHDWADIVKVQLNNGVQISTERLRGLSGELSSSAGNLPSMEGTTGSSGYGGSIIAGSDGAWVIGADGTTYKVDAEGSLTAAHSASNPRANNYGALVYGAKGAWYVKPDGSTIKLAIPESCPVVQFRNPDGSTVKDTAGATIKDQTLQSGQTATEPDPAPKAPTHSSFSYWSLYKDGKDPNTGKDSKYDFSTKVTQDVTLYAQYATDKVSVQFRNTDDSTVTGSDGSAIPDQSIDYGSAATKPSDPKRDNYVFGGWYTDKTLTTKYDFTAKVEQDTIIYAKWTATKNWAVKFRNVDANGNETSVANTSGPIPDESVVDGGTATRPSPDPDPASDNRTGYAFEGWYTDKALTTKYDFTTKVTQDVTIYAKWAESKPHTVKYRWVDAKGNEHTMHGCLTDTGSGCASLTTTIDDQTVNDGDKATKPYYPSDGADGTDQGIMASYKFNGWFADKTMKNRYDFDAPVTQDITIYAQYVLEDPGECTPTIVSASAANVQSGTGVIASNKQVWVVGWAGRTDSGMKPIRELTGFTGTVQRVIGADADSGVLIITSDGVWATTGTSTTATQVKDASGTSLPSLKGVSGAYPATHGVLAYTSTDAWYVKGTSATRIPGINGAILNATGWDDDANGGNYIIDTTSGAWIVNNARATAIRGTTGDIRDSGPAPLTGNDRSLVTGSNGVWIVQSDGTATQLKGVAGSADYKVNGRGYMGGTNYGFILYGGSNATLVVDTNPANDALGNIYNTPKYATVTGTSGNLIGADGNGPFSDGRSVVYGGSATSGYAYIIGGSGGSTFSAPTAIVSTLYTSRSGPVTGIQSASPYRDGGVITTSRTKHDSYTNTDYTTSSVGMFTGSGDFSWMPDMFLPANDNNISSDGGTRKAWYISGVIYGSSGAKLFSSDQQGNTSAPSVVLPSECVTVQFRNTDDTTPVGSDNQPIPDQQVHKGGTAHDPYPEPVLDKNKFEGWYTDKTLTTKFDFTTTIDHDTIIYAKWSTEGTTTPPVRVLAQTGGASLLLLLLAAAAAITLHKTANTLSKPQAGKEPQHKQ
ncbi:InlB B-repeat-containing protein [Bifidobacterium olomucense]|uniref:Listeria-Bacteroides repeat domain n=1 Tax=Bifidobacterium olomucense TaxID=2675324 RepID=A0A7Y0EY75_9BIFI|nr:InlB B-repeat-containing protein [Bifidobacterium sp. DSM 109959]NMM97526.1 Listeria-Bacteroides repeat domain [Bifidobacterium sp. DSM 109959]